MGRGNRGSIFFRTPNGWRKVHDSTTLAFINMEKEVVKRQRREARENPSRTLPRPILQQIKTWFSKKLTKVFRCCRGMEQERDEPYRVQTPVEHLCPSSSTRKEENFRCNTEAEDTDKGSSLQSSCSSVISRQGFSASFRTKPSTSPVESVYSGKDETVGADNTEVQFPIERTVSYADLPGAVIDEAEVKLFKLNGSHVLRRIVSSPERKIQPPEFATPSLDTISSEMSLDIPSIEVPPPTPRLNDEGFTGEPLEHVESSKSSMPGSVSSCSLEEPSEAMTVAEDPINIVIEDHSSTPDYCKVPMTPTSMEVNRIWEDNTPSPSIPPSDFGSLLGGEVHVKMTESPNKCPIGNPSDLLVSPLFDEVIKPQSVTHESRSLSSLAPPCHIFGSRLGDVAIQRPASSEKNSIDGPRVAFGSPIFDEYKMVQRVTPDSRSLSASIPPYDTFGSPLGEVPIQRAASPDKDVVDSPIAIFGAPLFDEEQMAQIVTPEPRRLSALIPWCEGFGSPLEELPIQSAASPDKDLINSPIAIFGAPLFDEEQMALRVTPEQRPLSALIPPCEGFGSPLGELPIQRAASPDKYLINSPIDVFGPPLFDEAMVPQKVIPVSRPVSALSNISFCDVEDLLEFGETSNKNREEIIHKILEAAPTSFKIPPPSNVTPTSKLPSTFSEKEDN